MDNNEFYTFSEYMKKDENSLTASMEDYLEMIYRLSEKQGFTRVHDLSESLNVQPPSATKMIQRLSEIGYLKYEKYGIILLEDKGNKMGELLLKRHNIIQEFLKVIGVIDRYIFEETEKIEHTISNDTLLCFSEYIEFINSNEDIKNRYIQFRINKSK